MLLKKMIPLLLCLALLCGCAAVPPELSGTLDQATSLSVASFQELSGLPQTGELDKVTWKHLALHYPLATNLSRLKQERKKL